MMKRVSRITMFTLALFLAYSPAKAVDWEKVGVGLIFPGITLKLVALGIAVKNSDQKSFGTGTQIGKKPL